MDGSLVVGDIVLIDVSGFVRFSSREVGGDSGSNSSLDGGDNLVVGSKSVTGD